MLGAANPARETQETFGAQSHDNDSKKLDGETSNILCNIRAHCYRFVTRPRQAFDQGKVEE